jgi:branched-chain amino acid transport system substrate-binding protein
MMFEGTEKFLKLYQERAVKEGTDPLGYYVTPYGYAEMQVLEQAIKAVGSLDQDKLANYIRAATFKTIVGDVKFGRDGEWVESRILFVQYQNVTGNSIEQFRHPGTQIILYPSKLKSGDFIYPYSDVKRN